MTNDKRKIKLHLEESDSRVVSLFPISQDAYDAFENQLQQIGLLPIAADDGEAQSVRQWTLYIGTLFAEVMFACSHLSVFQMPRVQHSLNRQLFEYYIRNRWMAKHPDRAKAFFDSLPKLAHKEVTNAPGVLGSDTKDALARNEREWANKHPEFAKQFREENFKEMADDVLGSDCQRDYFWLYTMPSLLVHAKPLGVPDVIGITESKSKERNPNSLFLNRIDELTKTIGIILQYSMFLALQFNVDTSPVQELNKRFEEYLRQFGITPEVVAVSATR